MASEYYKWLARNEKPEVPRELTRKEKRANWWYYNKWYVALGLLLLVCLVSMVKSALSQTTPDYQFAYVGTTALPDDTVSALKGSLAALGEDLNGDGSVTVQLVQYTFSGEADPSVAASSEVRLMADIMECESYFFLLEDPEQFQKSYHSLCRIDGTLPDEEEPSAEGTYLKWEQCPVLAGLDLGQYSYDVMGKAVAGDSGELMSQLSIARRGFWTEKTAPYPEGCGALWEKMTEGAVS